MTQTKRKKRVVTTEQRIKDIYSKAESVLVLGLLKMDIEYAIATGTLEETLDRLENPKRDSIWK